MGFHSRKAIASHPLKPPMAEKRPRVIQRHGDSIRDDHSWLREKDDPAVAAYLAAENAYADAGLAHTKSFQKVLYGEMLGRIKETDESVPYREGLYLYYSRTEEGKQYRIFCRKRSLEAPEEITIDVNALAEDHSFMALGVYAVSDDGSILAYSTDSTGFREYTLCFKDLRTGRLLGDRIERVGSFAWGSDPGTMFFTVDDPAKRPYRLYRHVLGGAEPDLIFEESDDRFRVYVERTRSKAYFLLTSESHTTSEVRFLPGESFTADWKVLAPRRHEREYDVDHRGDRFFIRVNDTGRNFRLVSVPVTDPSEHNWDELIPHRPDVMLEGCEVFAAHYVVLERQAGLPQIRVTHFDSGRSHPIPFPESVYDAGQATNREWESDTYRYYYESLTTPLSIYDHDVTQRTDTLLKRTPVLGDYDPEDYVSERLEAAAADGTAVPVSLVYRRGRTRDRQSPLLLIAYGSYAIPYPVSFSSNRLSLLDRGFGIAIAHVRGGGDLGRPWHDQGRMMAKMNTFTDFITAAEHLVERGYTSSRGLVIEGGSAGGLLMGAVVNMRPDLFRAVVMQVPFLDVLNTMSDPSLPLTVSEYEEWGNPEVKAQHDYIRGYDPYTNLSRGSYPALLVKSSFNDSQVMYWEPAKYTAKLRTLKTDRNPLLLITNMDAGHSGASGRYDRLKEIALDYAFMLDSVGIRE